MLTIDQLLPILFVLLLCLLQFCYLSVIWPLLSVVALITIYAHCFFRTSFSPLHTHSLWSRSDDPGFARPDIGRLVSFVQVFVEAVCFANSWSFFLFYSGTLIFLAFILLPDSCHISSVLIPVTILALDSYDIMRGCLYVVLQ